MRSRFRRTLRYPALFALGAVGLWCAAALWIDRFALSGVRTVLVAMPLLAAGRLIALRAPRRYVLVALAVAELMVVLWWSTIPPRQDRDWLPEVARTAWAEVDGDRITVHNVRSFRYRSETDFDPRWETRHYDLSRLVGMDMFFSQWGPPLIAHTILSWEFDDGRHLAVSIETRKEKGEEYSALLGFFRQFEIYYVVADERDVVALRTNHRDERVSLFRLDTTLATARELLLEYLRRINELHGEPAWYNALSHNCTTAIRRHAAAIGRGNVLDWRLFANGYLLELAYEMETVDTSMPLEELTKRSDVTAAARAAGNAEDFPERIRRDLPPRPGTGTGS